ncbi:guanine nucleotide exchange factor [Anaeramoeba flamelloides]|uniref:Guanine nucleotide exchange factor n=1 Tax=Anaeramoeba flamelloides TaxID=1746091 RepID=A0ABQ8Z360_9EUKA|nr:guanine nucleotide exchange factor [Anaeramoeba flamelloides]
MSYKKKLYYLETTETEQKNQPSSTQSEENVCWLSGMTGYGSLSLDESSSETASDNEDLEYSQDSENSSDKEQNFTQTKPNKKLEKVISIEIEKANKKNDKSTLFNLETNKKMNNPPKNQKKTKLFGRRFSGTKGKSLNQNSDRYQRTMKKSNSDFDILQTEKQVEYRDEQKTELEKHSWLSFLMRTHPEILETRERIRPLTGKPSFGKILRPGKTEITDQIGGKMILNLILQFLQSNNFQKSLQALQQESKLEFYSHYEKNNILKTILEMVVFDVDNIWNTGFTNLNQFQNETLKDIVLIQEKKNILIAEEDDELELISVWDDSLNNENNILFRTNLTEKELQVGKESFILAASLNKLIENLIVKQQEEPRFVKIFMMTYQSFTSPGKLLYKIFEAFDIPEKIKMEGETEKEFEERKNQLEKNIYKILEYWLLEHFNDFSKGLIDEIQKFITEKLLKGSKYEWAFSLRRIIKLQKNGKISQKNNEEIPPEPKVPKNLFSKKLDLFDFHAIELARQLSIKDFEIFSRIHQSELFNCAWSNPKLKYRAKNVLEYINRFNSISYWVSKRIIMTEGLKERAHVLRKFLKIAKHLHSLNNFNSLNSVLAGIQSAAVHRLKFTFLELTHKYIDLFNNLKQLMSGDGSFYNYRQLIGTIKPPCVPYLGIYLTDLTFIEDGNYDFKNGLINFSKRKLVYNVIEKIKTFQKIPYNLHPVHQIISFIDDSTKTNDSDLYELSLKIEPRGAKRNDIKL